MLWMQQLLLSGGGRRINKQDVGVVCRLMAGHGGLEVLSSKTDPAGTPSWQGHLWKEERTWNYFFFFFFLAFKHAKLTEYMSTLCNMMFQPLQNIFPDIFLICQGISLPGMWAPKWWNTNLHQEQTCTISTKNMNSTARQSQVDCRLDSEMKCRQIYYTH